MSSGFAKQTPPATMKSTPKAIQAQRKRSARTATTICWAPENRNMIPTITLTVVTDAASNWRITSAAIVQTTPVTSQSHQRGSAASARTRASDPAPCRGTTGAHGSLSLVRSEAVDEHPVPEPAVADGERVAAEQLEHGADDAGAGEDDLGAVGLQADDPAALVRGAGAEELDLPVDLAALEHRALHDVGVIGIEPVADRGEVRDGAAHPDHRGGRRPALQAREVDGDPAQRVADGVLGDGLARGRTAR